ncbi:hypothetical protein [Lacinutrix chionoecetis]
MNAITCLITSVVLLFGTMFIDNNWIRFLFLILALINIYALYLSYQAIADKNIKNEIIINNSLIDLPFIYNYRKHIIDFSDIVNLEEALFNKQHVFYIHTDKKFYMIEKECMNTKQYQEFLKILKTNTSFKA